MKAKVLIVCLLIIGVTATIGVALALNGDKAGREKSKQSNNDDEKLVNDKVAFSIPEWITKIRIIYGNTGETITMDGEDINQLREKMSSASGSLKTVVPPEGFTYTVFCYNGEEMVEQYVFMSNTILMQVDGGADTARQITTDETHPAYTYIEGLFDELRKAK